jgi:hypothetical protein
MHSTLKLRESDPHDVFAIAPQVVPVTWADKVLADITRDASSLSSDRQPAAASSAAAGAAAPTVDTTFRATAAGEIDVPSNPPGIRPNDRPSERRSTGSWAKSAVTVFMFALCSAFAAAGWQHYGNTAKQMIASWVPPFALTSSPPQQTTGLAGHPDIPAVQAAATDQAPPQNAPSAEPPEDVAATATAPSPETAQLQSMARDMAAMGQQIEQLKASIDQLRAGQQAMAVARTSEAKTFGPNLRPKTSSPPLRPAAALVRKPRPVVYSPAQTAAVPPLPPPLPQAVPALASPLPPPQAATEPDGEPVVRPPMPLR